MAFERGNTHLGREQQRRERERDAEAAANPVESGPTMNEILHDSADSKLFGAMIDAKADPALVEFSDHFRTGQLTAADMKKTEKLRGEFLDLKSRAEWVGNTMDARAGEMRAGSKTLESACQTFGQDNYLIALKQGLLDLAMKDPKQFAKYETQMKTVQDAEQKLYDPEHPLNKKIAEFSKKHSLSDDRVAELLKEPDFGKRRENIRLVIRGEMNWLEKFFDWAKDPSRGGNSSTQAREIAETKEEQDKEFEDLNAFFGKSGNLLVSFANKDPEIRKALATARPGETLRLKNSIESTSSFADTLNHRFTRAETMQSFQQYLHDDQHIDFDDYDKKSVAEKDVIKQGFKTSFLDKKKRDSTIKKGFWRTVWEWALNTKFDKEVLPHL